MNKQKKRGALVALIMGMIPWIAFGQNIQERLIYSTDFQDWEAVSSSTTPVSVSKITHFSNEPLTFNIGEVQIDPAGDKSPGSKDPRFNYPPASIGYAVAAKTATPYIETSPLKSVTKVTFTHGATGNNRGYKLYKKSAADTDWVVVSNVAATPSSGAEVTADINEKNVALKFMNFSTNQNAYLFDIRIYGNVEVTAEQVSLTTEVTPEGAGSITVSPDSPEYDKGTEVTLSATRNFGYKFSKWTDASGNTLSTEQSFTYKLDATSAIKAVFEVIPTYSLNVNTNGGKDYMIAVIPDPTVVNGINMYEEGTEVKLTPSANTIFTFNNWENGTTQPDRTFIINENIDVTATYSAVSYIVGWDFYQAGNTARAADFAAESTNAGILNLRNAEGTTNSWLDKSKVKGQYEGRSAAVNWKPFTKDNNFYYEASFSTKGYSNIVLLSSMLCNYNAFSVQKIEYSINGGTDFKELGTIHFETVKTWYDSRISLPADAEDADKLIIRWIPDYTSAVTGTISENDGTAISEIYLLADKEFVPDETAPVLLSSIPANNGTDVSASGSIILQFDERVQAGEGAFMLNNETLTPIFSGSTVIFKYTGLAYNNQYTFAIPAGAIKDMSGNTYAGTNITFSTMEKVQPAARLYDAVVSANGTGDYTTVQAAVNAAPENAVKPYLIFIKEGKYKEHVDIPAKKPYLHFIGQDVEKVIITDDQLCGGTEAETGKPSLHVSLGATVVVNANNFYAENIAFENSWGIDKNSGPQALALFTNSDRVILNNCKLRSYQDTYLTSTGGVADRHYLKNCLIEGAVDFIYGGGDVYFDECTLNIVRKSGGYIVAPSHKPETKWGYVFMNNKITAPAPAAETNIWLGRPWKDAPKTVFLNTIAEVSIPAAGWYESMGAIPAIFADYNTMDAAGNKIDLSNRIEDYWYWKDSEKTEKITGKAKRFLTDEEATSYTIKNVLSGNDNWQPTIVTEAIGTPVITGIDKVINWETVPYAICYIITKNEKVIGFTKDLTYTDTDGAENDIYTVRAANEFGGLSGTSNQYVNKGTSVDNTDKADSKVYTSNGRLFVNAEGNATVLVYAMNGTLTNSRNFENSINLQLVQGTYIVKIITDEAVKSCVIAVK